MPTQKTSDGKLSTWEKITKDKTNSSQDNNIVFSKTILDKNVPDAGRIPSNVRGYITEEEAMRGSLITDIKQTVSMHMSSVELVGKYYRYKADCANTYHLL